MNRKLKTWRVLVVVLIGLSLLLPRGIYAHNTNSTFAQAHYWFRDDDGGEACDSLPSCTTGATGYSSPDTAADTVISGVSTGAQVRLRVNLLKNNVGDLLLTTTPILDFKVGGACGDTTGWTQVPTQTSCGSTAICQATSSNFADGDTTSELLDALVDVGGDMIEIDGSANAATYGTGNGTDAAEWEWMLDLTNAAAGTTYTLRVSKDTSGTNYSTYTTCPTITTSAGITFSQNEYRWYVDDNPDSENVTDPWSSVSGVDIAENTSLEPVPVDNDPPNSTQELRLRANMTVNNQNLSASSQQFKLQFKAGTDGSCTTGSWTDVGASQAWEFATSSVTDGTTLTASKLTATDVLEVYAKTNPTATNPNGASTGQDIEYDFHIVGTNVSDATQYSFRAVESDGTVLDAYTNCPTLHTEPGIINLLRHGNFFSGSSEKGFWWTD
jgi:hypothetical protein